MYVPHKGFSFIETLIVISIVAVVGVSMGTMIQYFYKTNAYVVQEGTAVASAQRGIDDAMTALREASYGDDGAYPLQAAATSSVTFFADMNGTGGVEKVRYYLSKNTLYRGVTYSSGNPASYDGQPEQTSIVATYVQNSTSTPIFEYQDSNGTQLSSPISLSSVATIAMTLKIDVDVNRSPVVYTLLGTATLRNLRS